VASVKVSPTSLIFGTVLLGQSSASQTVTLQNLGNTLNISAITITGADPNDFTQTNTCGNSVPADGSCTITVTFTPQAAGSRAATLEITDDDPSAQGAYLKGTGKS